MDSTSKLLVIALVLLCLCCSSSAAAYGAGKVIKADEDQIKKDLKELELEKHRIANPMRVETEKKGFSLPKGLVARYNASSLSEDGKTWKDLSSQGNDIKSGNRKGKMKIGDGYKNAYVYGSKEEGFKIPIELTANKWTFFAVAKYNGESTNRIFDSTDINALWGWHGGKTGVYYGGNEKTDDRGGWVSEEKGAHGVHPWVLMTVQRDTFRTTTGQNGEKEAVPRTKKKGASRENMGKIAVNMGKHAASESSDWAIYEILLFSKQLKISDIKVVEEYLVDKYLLTEMPDVDIKQGHAYKADGGHNHFDKTPWFENTGTPAHCRRQAAKYGYKMWGHRSETHPENSWKNKCFFFKNPVEVKTADASDTAHNVACTAQGVELSNACKPESEKNE